MRPYYRQQGGTFVGIIIGLIIGLGIALAVAVAITKTPVPFINKIASKAEKTEKPIADQSADPNKPLYGNRVRPVLKDTAKSDDDGSNMPDKPAAPTTVLTDKPKKADAVAADSKDPIKDIIAAKTEAKSETRPDAEEKWRYFLQAGAFNDQGDAESSRAKLALMGVEARISEKPSPNGSGILYRVRVGPFVQLDAANRVRGRLSDNGVEATLVRIAK